MPKLEVRCCCDPALLHGHMEIADRLCREGQDIRFAMREPAPRTPHHGGAVRPAPRYLQLKVAEFRPLRPLHDAADLALPELAGDGKPYLALKDNGATIAELRMLRDFEEYHGD